MPADIILEVFKEERQRLAKAIADVDSRMKALNEEAAGYKRELAAIDAYERTRTGNSAPASTSSPRAARGSRSETLLALIAGNAGGMTRAQILEDTGAKGNKSQEGSISNALTTMKKAGKLTLDGGVYRAA